MTIIETLYLWGYRWKQRRAAAGRRRLPHPVISIGNLTVGGTGKTPATMAVAAEAVRRGYQPVVLTRGYQGAAPGPCFVTTGAGRLLSVAESGDEPALMADRLQGVPIVKCADRHAGGLFALRQLRDDPSHPFVFILDDGFQHWRLHRDIDIVLVDGLNPFGNGRLLPLGPLRGPLTELAAADFFVMTKARNDELLKTLAAQNPTAPAFSAVYETRGVLHADGTGESSAALRGKKVFAFCGIANPQGFSRTLDGTGATIASLKTFRDHYRYTAADLAAIRQDALSRRVDYILTTEKDLVKIREIDAASSVAAVTVDMVFDRSFFDALFAKLGSL